MKSVRLNDAQIREALILKLDRQRAKPRAIIEELHVLNGSAIADVVALHSEAHCYEIKGATDKISRIKVQGSYYNTVFRRITLVTTKGNLKRAIELAPSFWGVMVALDSNGSIKFRYVRAATLNPHFDKHSAAMTLWKSEMLELISTDKAERKPRSMLADLIAETRRELKLSMEICDMLTKRQQRTQSVPSKAM